MSVAPAPAPRTWTPAAGTVALLDLDPELGAQLDPERFAAARSVLVVPVVRLPRGEWAGAELRSIGHQNVGLLVVDGALAREVVIEDTVSTDLLGQGDLIRPWSADGELQLLSRHVRWHALADTRLAVLGRNFGAALVRFPEVNAALIERACAHARRLATTAAISHLNSVERRILALLWHLAERWGRVTAEGVMVPLALSHRQLGELVGARRPTVSAAVASLRRQGTLLRRRDATWLLTGKPPAASGDAAAHRGTPHRRQLLPVS